MEHKHSERLAIVDCLKGVAIMMVILVHSVQGFKLPVWSKIIPSFGQMGCQIFFVLSSFTLCLSLSRRQNDYVGFIKKRLLRIAPKYWIAILVFWVVGNLTVLVFGRNIVENDDSILDIAINVFLLHGVIPTDANNRVVRGGWFVGTLCLMYLITPALFQIYENRNRVWRRIRRCVFPLSVTMVGIAVIGLIERGPFGLVCENNSFLYFFVGNQLGCYSIGMVLYDVYTSGQTEQIRRPEVKGLIAGLVSVVLFYGGLAGAFKVLPSVFGAAVFYGFICLYPAEQKCGQTRLGCMLSAYGKISYEIYLMHSLIVYEGAWFVRKIADRVAADVPHIVIYALLFPVIYVGVYYLGKLFCKAANRMGIK